MVSLAGGVVGVSVSSSHKVTSPAPGPGQEESQASHLADSLHSTVLEKEAGAGQQPGDTAAATVFEFHDNTGRNVALCHGNTVARRHDSYNQPGPGDVRPAAAPGLSPASLHLPVPQLNLKRESWLVALGGGAGQRGPQEEVRAAYRLGQVPAPPSEASAGRRRG